MAIEALFRPLAVGAMTLANRVVMSPMTRSFSPGGVPGADVAAYYRRRAEGGVGLIVTEGVGIEDPAALDDAAVPHLYGAAALAGWKRVVDAVHLAGGLIVPQLWHQGPLRDPYVEARTGIAGLRPSGLWGTPGVVTYPAELVAAATPPSRPMTDGEIADSIAAFARAAAAAVAIGFDGVAIHGAHGYLIDTFFWHDTNRRTDRYGGSLRDRARFGAEIVTSIRAAIGPNVAIMFRFSQHKQQDYKARLAETPAQLADLLEPLGEAGVDLFDVSARRFYEPGFAGSSLSLAGWTRKLSGKPTVAVGSAGLTADGAPEQIAKFIERGEFDAIGVGRSVLHDPAWANRVRRGEQPPAFDPASLKVLT